MMGSFNGYTLTQKGRELLAKGVAGEQLTFTKIKIGDGVFNGDIKTLTSLINEKADFQINQIKNLNIERIEIIHYPICDFDVPEINSFKELISNIRHKIIKGCNECS